MAKGTGSDLSVNLVSGFCERPFLISRIMVMGDLYRQAESEDQKLECSEKYTIIYLFIHFSGNRIYSNDSRLILYVVRYYDT